MTVHRILVLMMLWLMRILICTMVGSVITMLTFMSVTIIEDPVSYSAAAVILATACAFALLVGALGLVGRLLVIFYRYLVTESRKTQ